MQAILSRDSLNLAATFAKRVAERKATLPILCNARLRATADGIVLTTTDLDRWATVTLDGSADADFDVTMPVRELADLAKRNKSDLVSIDAREGSAALDFEGSRASLHSLPSEDFPSFPWDGLDAVTRFEVGSDMLAEAFGSVAFAISTEETRYYLNGVYMHVTHDGMLRTVATDGHRLARWEWAAPEGAHGMPGVIVPRAAVADVLALIGKRKPPLPVQIAMTSSFIVFTCGNVTIQSKLVDGTFPDYQRVTPAGNDKLLTVDRGQLANVVKAVSTISSERGRAVKFDVDSHGDGAAILTLSVTNPDAGSASDCIEAEARGFTGGGLVTGFNAAYVLDILDVFAPAKGAKGPDVVTFAFSDPGSPVLVTGTAAHARVVCVQMPMRA